MPTFLNDPPDLQALHPRGQFSIRDVLYIFFRRKWQLLLVFCVIAAGGLFVASLIQPNYVSTTTLLLKPTRELKTMDPANPEDVRGGIDTRTLMQSELRILVSRPLAEIVVDDVGAERILDPYRKPGTPPSGLSKVANGFGPLVGGADGDPPIEGSPLDASLDGDTKDQQDIDVTKETAIAIVQGSLEPTVSDTLISLSFRGPKPQYCRDMLAAVVRAHQQRRVEVYRISPESFESETERIQMELTQTEEELEQLLTSIGVSSLEGEKNRLLSQIASLEEGFTESSIIVSASEARINSLRKIGDLRTSGFTDGGVRGAGAEDPYIRLLNENLSSLTAQELELSSKYPDNAIPLRNVREQIYRVKSTLARLRSVDTSDQEAAPIVLGNATAEVAVEMARLEGELATEVARMETLTKVLAETKRRLAEIEQYELPVTRLSRKLATLENSYAEYSAGLEKAKVYAALDNQSISNISVIQPPTLPLGPDWQTRNRVIAFTFFGAIFGSLAFVFLMSLKDHSFKTAEEIERTLGLKVLASFPRSKHHHIQSSTKWVPSSEPKPTRVQSQPPKPPRPLKHVQRSGKPRKNRSW